MVKKSFILPKKRFTFVNTLFCHFCAFVHVKAMPKPCCEYGRNRQKRRSKIRETFAFFIIKDVGIIMVGKEKTVIADSANE